MNMSPPPPHSIILIGLDLRLHSKLCCKYMTLKGEGGGVLDGHNDAKSY